MKNFLSRLANKEESSVVSTGRDGNTGEFSDTRPPDFEEESTNQSSYMEGALFWESLVKECATWTEFAQKTVTSAKERGRMQNAPAAMVEHALHRLEALLEIGHFFGKWDHSMTPLDAEDISIDEVLEDMLNRHISVFKNRNQTVRRKFKRVTVRLHQDLARALVKYLVTWASDTGTRIDLRLSIKTWPMEAQLLIKTSCEQSHGGAGYVNGFTPGKPDGLTWQLIKHLSELGKLRLDSIFGGVENVIILTFPHIAEKLEGLSVMEVDAGGHDQSLQMSFHNSTLTTARVMIISPDARTRVRIRDAIKPAPFEVESVGSIQQALGAFIVQTPDVIIVTEDLIDDHFFEFRDRILSQETSFPFIVIRDTETSFEISAPDNESASTVSLGEVERHLIPAVYLELSKSM